MRNKVQGLDDMTAPRWLGERGTPENYDRPAGIVPGATKLTIPAIACPDWTARREAASTLLYRK
jgi:hypothetical protein